MMGTTRRQFVQGVGVAGCGLLAGCGRLPGEAQQPARAYRVGRLAEGGPQLLGTPSNVALTQGLRDLGYVEGQNLTFEYAFAEGQPERLPELVAALVHHPVDVLVVVGHLATQTARDATSSIPIVMPISGDPVATGLVASLARPGGNITGLSSLAPQLSAKRLELLREALPGIGRVAVLWNAADPVKALDYRETEVAAQLLGLAIQSLPVRTVDDFETAFEGASREGADAVVVLGDSLTVINQGRIVDLAARRQLPVMFEPREGAVAGLLMSYGPNHPSMFYRAATYVDKILKGAKPADLPIEQPREFDFVINLQTAQALGLTIPQHVLLQATEVIQ